MADWIRAILDSDEGRKLLQQEELLVDVSCSVFLELRRRGVTQKQFAEDLGITPGRVSQLLSGQKNLTLRTLSDMAFALGLRTQVKLLDPKSEEFEFSSVTISSSRPMQPAVYIVKAFKKAERCTADDAFAFSPA